MDPGHLGPITGCTKASPGCRHCYAERMARRLQAMGQRNYVNGFKPAVHEHVLSLPLHWKKPRTVFVNSMSDLFLRDISGDFIQRVFNVMWQADWHVFQVLTKRVEQILESLLGPLPGLNLERNDWVIVGGESGPGARPMAPSWVKDIRDQCAKADVPFFFKQWGGVRKKKAGRLLEDKTWDNMSMASISG